MNRALYYNRIFWNFVRIVFHHSLPDRLFPERGEWREDHFLYFEKSALSMLPVSRNAVWKS